MGEQIDDALVRVFDDALVRVFYVGEGGFEGFRIRWESVEVDEQL